MLGAIIKTTLLVGTLWAIALTYAIGQAPNL